MYITGEYMQISMNICKKQGILAFYLLLTISDKYIQNHDIQFSRLFQYQELL